MFNFKQFSINQHKTAMKVGTDGVLLGAWAPVDHHPQAIMDIGTGTGLIALMLAQRSFAQQIDAIEIDADSYEQAVENFEDSPWNDRVFCYHASLDEFMEELEDEGTSDSELAQQYDLIVSNPPFYAENVASSSESRDRARQSQSLPFEDLIEASAVLLSEHGIFCVIIPYKEEQKFIALCESEGLFPLKITRVKGTPTSEIKRSLMAFSRQKSEAEPDELVLETARHQYTEDYRSLTSEFYLDKNAD